MAVENTKTTDHKSTRKLWRAFQRPILIAGAVCAVGLVLAGDYPLSFLAGPIAPALAIGLCITLLSTLALTGRFMAGAYDEHELYGFMYGQAMASGIVMYVYMFWYLLWRGAFLPEPSHLAMFLSLFGLSGLIYLFKKYT